MQYVSFNVIISVPAFQVRRRSSLKPVAIKKLLPPISFCALTPGRTIHLFCLKYSFALNHLTESMTFSIGVVSTSFICESKQIIRIFFFSLSLSISIALWSNSRSTDPFHSRNGLRVNTWVYIYIRSFNIGEEEKLIKIRLCKDEIISSLRATGNSSLTCSLIVWLI